jgi:hypothetical protein
MKYIISVASSQIINTCYKVEISKKKGKTLITVTDRYGFNEKVFTSWFDYIAYICPGSTETINIIKQDVAKDLGDLAVRCMMLISSAQ